MVYLVPTATSNILILGMDNGLMRIFAATSSSTPVVPEAGTGGLWVLSKNRECSAMNCSRSASLTMLEAINPVYSDSISPSA